MNNNTQQRGKPRPRIVLADRAGFCFGVRMAAEMAEKARSERPERLTMLGPLVHNRQLVQKMQGEGIETAGSVEEIPDGTVILSAHGVGPLTRERIRERGLAALDLTCPFVTRVHRAAVRLHREGYQVVVVGDRGHTEVCGVIETVLAAGGTAEVVSCAEEADRLHLRRRVGIVCQTTQRGETLAAVAATVCLRASEVKILNTLCGATLELQDSARRLARQVDVVVVVGGSRSANTGRLRELCAADGVAAYRVETAADLEESWTAGARAVGITAGASTPDYLIEEVARALNGGELPPNWQLRHPD